MGNNHKHTPNANEVSEFSFRRLLRSVHIRFTLLRKNR